jgi:hypothetical protein
MRRSLNSIQEKVTALKKKLQGRPVAENFGNREQMVLEDYIGNIYDYLYTERSRIETMRKNFYLWCQTYTGKRN